MRFELAFILNFRRHLLLKEAGRHLYTPSEEKKQALTVQRLLNGEFIPPEKLKALYALLVGLRRKLPYRLEKPVVVKNVYGNRETVREAYEVCGRLLLLRCATEAKRKQMWNDLKSIRFSTEDIGGYVFTYADLDSDAVSLLRSRRWCVYSPTADRPLPLPPAPEGLDSRLFSYQVDGVRMLMAGYRLLADEQGLGKTAQVLQFLKLRNMGRTLICCPASLKYNWKKEAVMWGGYDASDIHIISGTRTYPLPDVRMYIINYDILPYWYRVFSGLDMIVADECHKIQSEKAKRTQSFLRVDAKDRIFISGTPFTSRPMQMFTALHAIAPKVFGSQYDYGLQFCGPKRGMAGIEFKGATNQKLLHSILMHGICIRRLKSEVDMQLPSKMRVTVPLYYDEKKVMSSRDVASEIAELKEKIADSCNQFGPFEYEKQLAYLMKRESAFQWIEDFLECGRKLVIFAVHRRAISDIVERFPGISVHIDGSTSPQERQKAVDSFQNDEKVRLFVGNVQAAGVGITLTAASDTCTVEFSWLASDHLQAEDRVHRVGQTRGVMSYYLCAPGSIDETLVSIINRKAKVHGQIFDDLDDNMLNVIREERARNGII